MMLGTVLFLFLLFNLMADLARDPRANEPVKEVESEYGR
jgi:hypothetical protein